MKLGIDIGGVIIAPGHDRSVDTSFFGYNFLNSPAVEGAFDTIAKLNELFDEVHLVSKCGPKVQNKTSLWLKHNAFFGRTGVLPSNVHFCLERKDKAEIALRLGLSAFIDDRVEILGYLADICDTLICFNAKPNEVRTYLPRITARKSSTSIEFVRSWDTVFNLLSKTVANK